MRNLVHEPPVVKLLWTLYKAFQAVGVCHISGPGALTIRHPFHGASVTVTGDLPEGAILLAWNVLLENLHNLYGSSGG